MAKQVPFHITSGLPFSKTIITTLPNGRSWWTTGSEFEALAQIRESNTYESPLILDIAAYITMTFNSPDEVVLELVMSGAETRLVTSSGYYDIILSDNLTADEQAIQVISGPVHRTAVVSSDTENI